MERSWVQRPDLAGYLLEKVNRERTSRGLPALSWNEKLASIAARHTEEMAAKNTIYHNQDLFTPSTRSSLGARALGENVAMNPDIDDAHARLMASDKHRANILDRRFLQAGFAVVKDSTGEYFITEDFMEPLPAKEPPATVRPARTGRAPAAKAPSPTPPRAPARRPSTPPKGEGSAPDEMGAEAAPPTLSEPAGSEAPTPSVPRGAAGASPAAPLAVALFLSISRLLGPGSAILRAPGKARLRRRNT